MDVLFIKDYYAKSGYTPEEGERAAALLKAFQERIPEQTSPMESCSVTEMKAYLSMLPHKGLCDGFILLALARAAYLSGNREVYIYFTQIIERESIISNLKRHIIDVLGEEKAAILLRDLPVPSPGAPPDEALPWTQRLLERMEDNLSEEECRAALTANAHGIPPEAFTREQDFFQKAPDLTTYLEESHNRAVSTLQEHADSGKVWFEQIISRPVVDFVASNREILGGVLEGDRIYWTKIPYDTVAWLDEKDRSKKRYYACHCPMAREVLLQDGESIPGKWCNCTAGFVQQRFNALFGERVQVDLLESVLAGDDRCRFAIHVPERFLRRSF